MTIGKIHYTKRYARHRLQSPIRFDPRSFRTVDVGRKGHTKLIVACPKGEYVGGRCRVGTQTQAILYTRVKSHSRKGRRVRSYRRRVR